jgi:asparagine synthetase B (glutamine-hydrolysing)
MNLIYGFSGDGDIAAWDARVRAALAAVHGTAPPPAGVAGGRPAQGLGCLHDGGAVAGRAVQGEVELAYIGAVTLPLSGWTSPDNPIDDPDATARFLLERYLSSGKASFSAIQGQFALAVVDRRAGLTLLATDPTGGRSWFVFEDSGELAFSSNLYCLAKSLGPRLRVDRSLEDFFLVYGFHPFGRTPFAGIRALPAGTVLEWREGRSQTERTAAGTDPWLEDAGPAAPLRTEADVVDALYAAMQRATLELLPARPQRLGVLLGGFDSALVAAFIKRLGFEVETYSFHYADPAFNQPHTDTLARHLGIRHHWVEIDRAMVEEGIRNFATYFNQPTNWPNYVIQTAQACAAMRAAGIRHCYSGDGCDSIFLGYPGTYRRARLFHALPRLPAWAAGPLASMAARPFLERTLGHPYRVALSLLRGLGRPMPARGYLSFRIFDEVSLRQLRRDAAPVAEKGLEELALQLSAPHAGLPPLRLAYLGKAAVSPNRNKMVGSSDASGVTVLAPYLHAGLKSFATRLPEELMRPRGRAGASAEGKYILMRMAVDKGLLPPAIVTQKKMAAVDAPIDDWYAGPMRDMLLAQLRDLPFEYDVGYVSRLLDLKASEKLFKRYVMVDKVISHAPSLLATYAAFAGLAGARVAASPAP